MAHRLCNECGRPCFNTCTRCGKGYCATCRDAAHHSSCGTCRQRIATQKTTSSSIVKRSRNVQPPTTSPAYTPPPSLAAYVVPGAGGTPPGSGTLAPIHQVSLLAMSESEIDTWLAHIQSGLEDAQKRGRAYLDHRASRGTQTATDLSMERDQQIYQELLAALSDIKQLWAIADADHTRFIDALGEMSRTYPVIPDPHDKVY